MSVPTNRSSARFKDSVDSMSIWSAGSSIIGTWARQHQLSGQRDPLSPRKGRAAAWRPIAGAKKLAQNAPHRLGVIAFEDPLRHPVKYLDVALERLVVRVIADCGLFHRVDGSWVRRRTAAVASPRNVRSSVVSLDSLNADDRQALPRREQQGQIRKQWRVEALANWSISTAVRCSLPFGSISTWMYGFRRLDVLDLDLLDRLGAGSRLLHLGFVGAKPTHEFLELGNAVLGVAVLRQWTLAPASRRSCNRRSCRGTR